ncbi:Tol-Pal system protein TolB [subsurface metagenome]
MARENLLKKLGKQVSKKVLPYVLSSFLALGGLSTHYGCSNNFVEPEPEKPITMLSPVAMLTANPTEGKVPLEVYFDGSESTCDPNCYLKEYRLDFDGDGIIDKVSGQPGMYHTYEETGTYEASLVVVDNQGQISDNEALEKIVVKFVDPKKPVAMLIADPTEGDAPLEVSFDGSMSYAREGYLEQYLWDFDGDGNTDLTTSGTSGAWVDHIYEEGGEYEASLVVVDNQGQISDNEALETIVVNENILGRIAFWSNPDWESNGCPDGTECNEDIYSGDIVIRDDDIELVNLTRLTTDPGQDFEPAWSPDGDEILFTTNRDGFFSIYRMNADGTNQRDITSNIVERAYQADWGSNGNILVAYRDFGDTVAGIGIINPDTNYFTPIYSESISSRIPGWPKWSPDCSKIAFQKYVDGNWEIYIMNPDGNNLERITNDPAIDVLPDWSPYRNEILFCSDRANPNQTPVEADLYLMDSDGNNVMRLTYALGREVDPEISPEGEHLLFERLRFLYDPSQIYLTELINAGESTKWIQLTTKGANCYPSWRPKIEN